jgi:hypothetical protein
MAMNVEVPSGVTVQGPKLVYTTSRPLASPARELEQRAADMKRIGIALKTAGGSLSAGAPTIDKAITETSRKSIDLIGQLDKTISSISSKELPGILDDLRKTSVHVRTLGRTLAAHVDLVSLEQPHNHPLGLAPVGPR